MVCLPAEVSELKEEQLATVITWTPNNLFSNCRQLKPETGFMRIYSEVAETYIIEGSNTMTVDIRFIDNSFSLNQELPAGKKYMIIPAFRPIQWIHFTSRPVRVCAFSGGNINGTSTSACDSGCRMEDLTAENSMIVTHPRVLDKPTYEFFLTAENVPDKEDVTLCTILTYDRFMRLRQMAEMYQGPISAAVFLVDTETEMPLLFKEWMSSVAMRKYVNVHLVIDDKINSINWPDRPFPVNILRNVALNYARTEYISFIEADFIPNRGFRDSISLFKEHMKTHRKAVYIIPSFYTWNTEIASPDFDLDKFPNSKNELQGAANRYQLKPMNEVFQSHSQIPYSKWWTVTSEVISVGPLSSQEPYYIAHRTMPRFEPVYIGCGQDKVQHTVELNARGYEYFMIPQGFIVHLDSTGMGSAWCTKFNSRWGQMKSKILNERISHTENTDTSGQLVPEWWDLAPSTTTCTSSTPSPDRVTQETPPARTSESASTLSSMRVIQEELDKRLAELTRAQQKLSEIQVELDQRSLACTSLQGVLKDKDNQIATLNSTVGLYNFTLQLLFITVSIISIFLCCLKSKSSRRK